MKKLILLVIILVCKKFSIAQAPEQNKIIDSSKVQTEEIWYPVDILPSFPGGIGNYFEYISKNLKYPEDAKKDRIEGKVFVEFLIDYSGSINKDSVKIFQGLSETCDKEAIRLIQECPNWIPAYCTMLKKNVTTKMVLPITFKLKSD